MKVMDNNFRNKLKVIITGATGMVGEGVFHQCLLSDEVEKILVINRKPCGVSHPKLTEIIHKDFYNLSAIENRLGGYNSCFFCLGVSSVGKNEKEYYELTYTLTMHVAQTLNRLNPSMIFCYISGAGTDSSEKGRMMWARVKGKTENDLMKLSFKNVYNFRPAVIQPIKGMKNTLAPYKFLGWLIPVIKLFAPNTISSLSDLSNAMINAATKGYEKNVLEVKDINALAKR